MVQEWHESRYGSTASNCPTYPSPNVGVQADSSSDPIHNQGQHPRLVFEFRGGHVNSDGTGIENNFVVPERDATGSVKPLQYGTGMTWSSITRPVRVVRRRPASVPEPGDRDDARLL
jgi:hypothetical protein